MTPLIRLVCILALSTAVVPTFAAETPSPVRFAVRLDAKFPAPTGWARAFVFLEAADARSRFPEPRFGPDWFRPQPFCGWNPAKIVPGEDFHSDETCLGFPTPPSGLKPGRYRMQAVLDTKFAEQSPGNSAGNRYSAVAEWDFRDGRTPPPLLLFDRTVEDRPFPQREFIREIRFESPLLTRFHGRKVEHRAGVILPKSYKAGNDRRYPVTYEIPGFSGTARAALQGPDGSAAGEGEVELIRVVLDPQCGWGHHVFADGVLNGPRGTALVTEFIPFLDKQLPTVADPRARFLTGHSSGGWSSLWLQATYPETFGGVWSTSPDPVDFRDFQRIDLTAVPPPNMFVDEAGKRRPLARFGGKTVVEYETFSRMDDVIDRGGQMRSFEAVFSPLDARGEPRRLWDRRTGRIDPDVAASWAPYDISLNLRRNWKTLGPKLQGKLHVYMGEEDTFFLEGAVRRLRDDLRSLGSDAEVRMIPGADHSLPEELQAEIRRGMARKFKAAFPDR